MILNTGDRTDIPAFYSEWFYNRIKEGFVLARNPYYPDQVTRYVLSADVIDILVFCTKNPKPMFEDFDLLSPFKTFWYVTITPYGKETEPFVPEKEEVIDSLLKLSDLVGIKNVGWRYDPIFITEKYSLDFHIRAFEKIAVRLRGYVKHCVISFIDLYSKTKRNFPEAGAVSSADQKSLTEALGKIAEENGMKIHLCCENPALAKGNVDADGCLSKEILEEAIGARLNVPKRKPVREGCSCLLGSDIGAYNTCGHGCRYCYANYDRKSVLSNMRRHNKFSPFLIGESREGDKVKAAKQKSWCSDQKSIFDL